MVAAIALSVAHVSGWLLDELFILSLALATAAQVIAYRNGERSARRRRGMWCGIAAILLMFVAGQIAAAKLVERVNAIDAAAASGAS